LLIRPAAALFAVDLHSAGDALAAGGSDFDPEAALLRLSEERLTDAVAEAFPQGGYTVAFREDETGRFLEKIEIITEDEALGAAIKNWLAKQGVTETEGGET
ncbi:MAG: hypothetical protein II776_07910, partial [Clostridia bacterium]|nr:hypothetical protein [Clostridia bacterium]